MTKFVPRRSEAEHDASRLQRLPTILNICVSVSSILCGNTWAGYPCKRHVAFLVCYNGRKIKYISILRNYIKKIILKIIKLILNNEKIYI